jgi:hypothetical protein
MKIYTYQLNDLSYTESQEGNPARQEWPSDAIGLVISETDIDTATAKWAKDRFSNPLSLF